jgi:hypothetical protein
VLIPLSVLVATVVGPAPPPALSLTASDLATLADAEARPLPVPAGHRVCNGTLEGRSRTPVVDAAAGSAEVAERIP